MKEAKMRGKKRKWQWYGKTLALVFPLLLIVSSNVSAQIVEGLDWEKMNGEDNPIS